LGSRNTSARSQGMHSVDFISLRRFWLSARTELFKVNNIFTDIGTITLSLLLTASCLAGPGTARPSAGTPQRVNRHKKSTERGGRRRTLRIQRGVMLFHRPPSSLVLLPRPLSLSLSGFEVNGKEKSKSKKSFQSDSRVFLPVP